MKKYIFLLALVFVGVVAWRIGERLSSDAISMGLGVMFGVLAGVPTAILVMAGNRRRDDGEVGRRHPARGHGQPHYPQLASQPPVIVLTGGPMAAPAAGGSYGSPPEPYGHGGHWPPQPTERRFKVVGETEEWLEEW